MFRVLGVGGYKDSGKTEVVVALVRELVRRGYRVGTVKHLSGHPTIDRRGTDTWRHAEAGSRVVVALSGEEVAVRERGRKSLREVLLSLRGLDFVLLEGFKREEVVKVMVARSEEEAGELDDEFTAAFVGRGVRGKPLFSFRDHRGLADLVEERATTPVGGLDCGECGFGSCREFLLAAASGGKGRRRCAALEGEVELWVGGKRVPLNPFVRRMVSGTVRGMLSSLKGGKGGEVELRLRGR
jgi:molybdopterin-guanine dinucleotide biosynthesis protein B